MDAGPEIWGPGCQFLLGTEMHDLSSVFSSFCYLKIGAGDFPGGAVVKSLPANAGDMGSSLVREDPTCRGATKPVRHNY